MKTLVCTANFLAWPVIQVGIARWMLQRPVDDFRCDGWLTRGRRWERGGRVYKRLLGVQRWKKLLPDGAPWLGGRQKRLLTSRSGDSLQQLAAETRRGELAHWYMLACAPLLFLWNPPWACGVMMFYGLAANLPCIVVQRYNRARIVSG